MASLWLRLSLTSRKTAPKRINFRAIACHCEPSSVLYLKPDWTLVTKFARYHYTAAR